MVIMIESEFSNNRIPMFSNRPLLHFKQKYSTFREYLTRKTISELHGEYHIENLRVHTFAAIAQISLQPNVTFRFY